MKTKNIITLISLFITLIIHGQISDSILIRGQIISKNKNSISGVSVSARNTMAGAVSDICGRFEIFVPIEGVLDFSALTVPYSISVCDIAPKSDTVDLIFRIDFKEDNSHCHNKNKRTRQIKLEEQGDYNQRLTACFSYDFERLTWKYYNYYQAKDDEIIILVNGNVMDKDFSPKYLKFTDFEQVFVFENFANNPNVLILISMNEKGK
jgi:hypothetical protein